MTPTQKHSQTAREFLEAASWEFAAGDNLQGSEKMWGAAAHAVMAAAQQRGWPFGSHYAIKNAADRLAEEQADQTLKTEFAVAESFHANFYHDFMESDDIERAVPGVRNFVGRVLELV